MFHSRKKSIFYTDHSSDYSPSSKQPEENKTRRVNTALKKLAKSYNSNTLRSNCHLACLEKRLTDNSDSLKSKSDISTPLKPKRCPVSCSSPVIQSCTNYAETKTKVEPYKNTFTMTKPLSDKQKARNKVMIDCPSESRTPKRPIWTDQRLTEKYSLLKMPWKRSHTLPVCCSKPSMIAKERYLKNLNNYSDKKTYIYDDGTEVDSIGYLEPETEESSCFLNIFQGPMLTLLNFSAYICALLVLSLIIWFIMGNHFHKWLLPKPPENPLKQQIKYIGGGIIYTVSTILKFIGRIFVKPASDIFSPPTELWPPST